MFCRLKVETFVEFPIQALDMNTYVLNNLVSWKKCAVNLLDDYHFKVFALHTFRYLIEQFIEMFCILVVVFYFGF